VDGTAEEHLRIGVLEDAGDAGAPMVVSLYISRVSRSIVRSPSADIRIYIFHQPMCAATSSATVLLLLLLAISTSTSAAACAAG